MRTRTILAVTIVLGFAAVLAASISPAAAETTLSCGIGNTDHEWVVGVAGTSRRTTLLINGRRVDSQSSTSGAAEFGVPKTGTPELRIEVRSGRNRIDCGTVQQNRTAITSCVSRVGKAGSVELHFDTDWPTPFRVRSNGDPVRATGIQSPDALDFDPYIYFQAETGSDEGISVRSRGGARVRCVSDLEADAAAVAQDLEMSVAEAIELLTYEEAISEAMHELAQAGLVTEENFAGAVQRGGPHDGFDLYLKRSQRLRNAQTDERSIAEVFELSGVDALAIRDSDWSEVELLEFQKQAVSSLADTGLYREIVSTIAFDDQPTISIDASPSRSAVAERLPVGSPRSVFEVPVQVDVSVRATSIPLVRPEGIWGGSTIWNVLQAPPKPGTPSDTRICTSGFSATKLSNGREGQITALHCFVDFGADGISNNGDSSTKKDLTLNLQSTVRDVAFGLTDGNDLPFIYVKDGPGTQTKKPITGVLAASDYWTNRKICHYGQTTKRSCGRISDPTILQWIDGEVFGPMVAVTGVNLESETGDSGGPWFVSTRAAGIHHGRYFANRDKRLFVRAYVAEQDLGVQIQTQ